MQKSVTASCVLQHLPLLPMSANIFHMFQLPDTLKGPKREIRRRNFTEIIPVWGGDIAKEIFFISLVRNQLF
jgi:hypothetical protein